jgi:hypothetical protein
VFHPFEKNTAHGWLEIVVLIRHAEIG